MLRLLFRLLSYSPVATFAMLAALAVLAVGISFVLKARRQRTMAELAEDESALAAGRRGNVLVVVSALAVACLGAWLGFFRVVTSPDTVVVAVSITDADGTLTWSFDDDDAAAVALARNLGNELGELGLEVVDHDRIRQSLAGARSPADIQARSARLGAGMVALVELEVRKTLPLPQGDGNEAFNDYIFAGSGSLIDVAENETVALSAPPERMFLWGHGASDAVLTNVDYVSHRFVMSIAHPMGQRPSLRVFAREPSEMSADEQLDALRLTPLFRRARGYDEAISLRAKHIAEAEEGEKPDFGRPRTRLGEFLDQEYYIGTAADGRAILMHEPRVLTVPKDQLGYVLTDEGETMQLAGPGGDERTLLFEHHNFFSYPELSAGGSTLAVVLANHGASKSLATISVPDGELHAILTHPTEYYSTPHPSPDGSQIAFFSRPDRHAASALEVVDVASAQRTVVVPTGSAMASVDWAPDGSRIFVTLGNERAQRVVQITLDGTKPTRLLGPMTEDELVARVQDEASENSEIELESLDLDVGPDPDPDPRIHSTFDRLSVSHDGRHLFVSESDNDGFSHVGIYALETGEYRRLAHLSAYRLEADPKRDRVAVMTTSGSFSDKGDPSAGDSEVVLLDASGAQSSITINEVEDDLIDWDRDGTALYIHHSSKDASDRYWTNRVYRYEIP